ncbi:hypothetical protein DPMN_115641 [Dreissena polymorpha]|uniref:Uncharacterized protein n=1 Tax=Dreissena polymorpha TaxID=45954 RepID=A0A9D4QTJ2_DREPO|nr:hypothetical protein DPMN_115641 [Dreissena polymorpha]
MKIGHEIFDLDRGIIGTNLLTKFQEDQTKMWPLECLRTNVDGQTTDHKSSPEQSGIIGTNFLTKIHRDWTRNVPSRVFTRKTAPPTGDHTTILTNFELDRGIIGTNLLTKFHDDRTRNVASSPNKENCSPHWPHVFQRTRTTFELNQDIIKTSILTNFELERDFIGTKLLTKFHEDLIQHLQGFELDQDIIGKKLLTKFHEDRTKKVASRVFTRKTAPPTGRHVFQQTGTTFEINQDIIKTTILKNFELERDFIGTKLLTKFHEDRTRNVASRVFMNKCERTDDGQRPVTKAHLS